MRKLVVVLLAVCSLTAFCAVTGTNVSSERIATLQALFDKLIQAYEDDATIDQIAPKLQAMLKECDKACHDYTGNEPLRNEKNADEDAEARLNAALDAIYPIYTDEVLDTVAAEAYPMYKRGDFVTIIVRTVSGAKETYSGYFQSFAGSTIVISNRHIIVRDVRGIQSDDYDGDVEITKYDPALNARKRAELKAAMVAERATQRETWIKENRDQIYMEQGPIEGELNEKNGYTFYENSWLSPSELVYAFTSDTLMGRATRAAAFVQSRADEQTALADSRLVAAELASAQVPPYKQPSAVQLAADIEQAALLAQQEAERAAQLAAEQAERDRLAALEAAKRSETPQEVELTSDKNNMPLVMGIVVLLLAGGGLAFYIKKRRDEADLDVSEFFKGKGEEQKRFWDMANANPKFYYVAYLFPSDELATNALGQLTYMETDDLGAISTSRDIMFGTYGHAKGAVCYVGGKKLNYALWREASAVWPELPQAQYFKVSKEPLVQLAIPDMNMTGIGEVKDLGQEDVRNEDGSFTKLFKYWVGTPEQALKFIEKFEIKEEGITVSVQAPGIHYGRDINGFFEIQD